MRSRRRLLDEDIPRGLLPVALHLLVRKHLIGVAAQQERRPAGLHLDAILHHRDDEEHEQVDAPVDGVEFSRQLPLLRTKDPISPSLSRAESRVDGDRCVRAVAVAARTSAARVIRIPIRESYRTATLRFTRRRGASYTPHSYS